MNSVDFEHPLKDSTEYNYESSNRTNTQKVQNQTATILPKNAHFYHRGYYFPTKENLNVKHSWQLEIRFQ